MVKNRPHKTVSRYTIGERIGSGASGTVYEAWETSSGKRCALKMLDEDERTKRSAARLFREFTFLADLEHPNLVKVLDLGTDRAVGPFIVMEYAEGVPITEFFKQLKIDALAIVIQQITDALDYMHRSGCLHGDIKPAHILITNDKTGTPRAKLLDLGLACACESDCSLDSVGGTPGYMPPEVFCGGEPDGRSDLYSLGVVLYQVLTKMLPFRGEEISSTLKAQMTETPPSPAMLNAGVPDWLSETTMKLISRDPADRFSSARSLMLHISNETGGKAVVSRSLGGPVGLLEPAFIGRQRELEEMLKAIHPDESTGSGRLILIQGEEGIGKTRLLREHRFKLRLENTPVVSVSGTIGPGKLLFKDLIDQLGGLMELDVGDYPNLSHILSDLPERPADFAIFASGRLNEKKVALFEEILEIMSKCREANERLALFIDDIDSTAPAFAEFVLHLARSLESLPKLVIYLTALGESSAKFLPELLRIGQTLPLSGLERTEIGELISSMFGEPDCPDEVKETLLNLTGGNPLFLQETVREMTNSGALSFEEDVFSLKSQQGIECSTSEMLAEMLSNRLDGIPEAEMGMLEAASILGQSFEVSSLKKICRIRRSETIWKRLMGLRSTGILIETGDGRFSFRHQLLRNLIYDRMDEDSRRDYHLAAVDVAKSEKPVRPGLIGYHFAQAGRGRKAVPYLLEAAHEARQSFFMRDAESYFSRAISVWPEAERDSEEYVRASVELAEVLAVLGQAQDASQIYESVWDKSKAHLSAGERCAIARHRGLALASIGQAKSALKWYEKVVSDLGGISTDCQAYLSNSIGMAYYSAGEYEAARDHFNRVLELLSGASSTELARAYRQLSIVADTRGRQDDAVAHARKAVEVAEAMGDEREKAHARISLGILLGRRGETKAAIPEFMGALSFFEPRRSLEALACIYNNLGNEYEILGDLQSVLKYRKEAFTVSRLIEDKMASIYAYRGLGGIQISLGNWDEAKHSLTESLRLSQELGESRQIAISLRWMGHLHCLKGNLEEAGDCADRALELLRESDDRAELVQGLILQARVDRFEGCVESAEHASRKALALVENLDLVVEKTTAAVELAQILLDNGAVSDADDLFATTISPLVERESSLAKQGAFLLLARIRLLQGRYADAAVISKRVKSMSEQCGIVYEGALADLLFAESAFLEGGYREAKNAIGGTISAFKKLGASLDIAQAEKLLRKLDSMNIQADRASADLTLIYEMSRIFNSMLNLDELLSQVMDYVLEKMDAERGIIMLRESDSERLEVVAARNVDRQTIEDVSETSNSIVAKVMEVGEPIVSTNAMDDPRFKSKQSIMLHKIRSLVCVPLKIRDEIVGTIYVDNRITAGLFSEADVKFLTAFSNYAAMAMDRSKMYERLRADRERLANENIELRKSVRIEFGFDAILGESEAMKRVFNLMHRIIPTSATVLILGRSGTGKELVARAIHYNGPRKDKPFIKVNCATLPENLLESELFGHEKGAYTGADKRKMGKFELADTGTIFLDEIAEIKPSLQAKLLQVIEDKQFERVGGTRQISADVRVLAATNREMTKEIEAGAFREDLYYRLCEVVLQLPNLADRAGDIPVLVDHFLAQFSEELGRDKVGITAEAMDVLKSYDWPGNVRELRHALYRAVIATDSAKIDAEDMLSILPMSRDGDPTFFSDAAKEVMAKSRRIANSKAPLRYARAVFEGSILRLALREAGENLSEAARRLGIHRKSFKHLIDEYDDRD
ncbi:MAG: sigma 54-interacting transcriptional regulator [Candidatus Coatesbacteria bacterium]|nr:sigma 54-interacting transcriptional regulator [Candidatus Coatesbacteria bacterium]